MANGDPIEHVIVLALENRSFDHMLGDCQTVKPEIDGIPPGAPPRTNQFDGQTYEQTPGAARVIIEDPRHETPHVLVQLKADAAGVPNSGFVEDYARAYPMLTGPGRAEVMKYHEYGSLPALHALATNFAVCDRWFASVPGPTWANRLFLMSGTCLGRVNMPNGIMDLNLHWYDQPTLFDRLNDRSIDWKAYHGDTPLSLLLAHQWEPHNAVRHKPIGQFYRDVAAPANGFPKFAFIEPAYLEPGANDDHPSHDVLAGEALIANIYNALRANTALWNSSLLIVLFDEHGGFYDHVAPPKTIAPDHHQDEYTFDRLGVRVPVILASPWFANTVLKDMFDHTSLLKYLTDKWQLGPLGERTPHANTFAGNILGTARLDTPASIPSMPASPPRPTPVPRRQPLNEHQTGLVALSHALESMVAEDPAVVAARSRQIVTGPQNQIDTAVERVETFLEHKAVELAKKL